MDFEDSAEEAAFRLEARRWIAANAPKYLKEHLLKSTFGIIETGPFDLFTEAKKWMKRKAEAGWSCIHWPREFGGRGGKPIESQIWTDEEGIFSKLNDPFLLGHGMCGPTLLAFGTEEQKRRYLPRLISGEDYWCQMFSEPQGGSDLAGLRSRAVRHCDGWLLSGQKIWTSGAQFAQYGIVIARTDPNVPKHMGLTMFVLDLRSAGVAVRPIRQANGLQEFNEVFFDDVRIADSDRVGDVGAGWKVALTTLMNERFAVGGIIDTGFKDMLAFLRSVTLDEGPALQNSAVRARVAEWHVRTNGLRFGAARTASALSRDEAPGPESSITKLVAGSTLQEIAQFALDIQGLAGAITDSGQAQAAGRFQAILMRSPATRIEGGTDQVLKNIIAERVLGLPPDVRLDKNVPFNQVPTAAH